MTGGAARIWPPVCNRAAAHLAGRERELTLTLAAAAGWAGPYRRARYRRLYAVRD
jgi:hypothetical protein